MRKYTKIIDEPDPKKRLLRILKTYRKDIDYIKQVLASIEKELSDSKP